MGRGEERSSSNRPELAAFVLALRDRDTPMTTPMLYLYDNWALLDTVSRWVVEGGNATLVRSSDANILREAINLLRKRIQANTATFLVMVKAHRGEPTNERADIQADEAASNEKMDWEESRASELRRPKMDLE